MGSKQSTPLTPPPPPVLPAVPSAAQEEKDSSDDDSKKKSKKSSNAKNLSGFALVQYNCRRKRRAYDKCYAKWYGGSFVTAKDVTSREESCDDLFDEWKECILLGMKKDREKRGLEIKEGSMLSEVVDDDDGNDMSSGNTSKEDQQ